MGFTQLFNAAPRVYKDHFWITCFHPFERVDYHPEQYLSNHIQIVVNRCLRLNDPDLLMVAFLHDICKYQPHNHNSVGFRKKTNILPEYKNIPKDVKSQMDMVIIAYNGQEQEFKYYTNPFHPEDAVKFIDRHPEIQKWIKNMGADLDNVKRICKLHMRMKVFPNMKKTKQANFIFENMDIWGKLVMFSFADDMKNYFPI